jgi:hypothetical protein
MNIIMRYNVFEFGDTIFRQLTGTAMGTPVACIYAMIYYSYHEEFLLHKYKEHIVYYSRFIDDGFGLWKDLNDPTAYDRFCADVNNFGTHAKALKWTNEDLSDEVIFLDLKIRINASRRIETRTYQKPMNLYLYLHHASAHPPGVLKGMIHGCIRRYKLQNTRRQDYLEMIRLLYLRLIARGHNRSLLKTLMIEAVAKLESGQTKQPEQEIDNSDRLFLHIDYHANGIQRHQLRDTFEKTCDNFRGTAAEIQQVTVAFSRPTNLRDELTSARLHQIDGQEVSTYRP